MLAGKGIDTAINMAGGIKAWGSNKAMGSPDQGMHLFDGSESLEDVLVIAYSMEHGLKDFYVSMIPRVVNEEAKSLFERLSRIEVKHKETIFNEYIRVTGESISQSEFEKGRLIKAMEGGLTTEEYLALYSADMEVVEDVIGFAMAIEAQALDLYQRASDRSETDENRQALLRIAEEERAHLKQLARLLD
jgi:rubrerythrin